ncbi:MAG: hypothetical protein JWN83_2949 [Chitinophagaceae bacterium]|nr:hypothetical protein [Chitinophagaceae bacterium]
MNKIISIAFFASFLFIGIISCKKNNLVIDQAITPPSYAKFNVRTAADTVATYYVKSDNAPFKIPIGITTVSDKDRTINLCYSSTTAVAGAQYTAPATIVIPAGKSLDSLSIQGLFAGYPLASRIDLLTITICGGDVPPNAYWTTYKLTMRKYCDVTLSSFYGAYTKAIDNGNYGPYPMTVKTGSAVSTGATSGSIQITNLWDYGDPSITTTVNLDWSNPAAFAVTIPDQVYYAPDGLWIKGTTAGTFSSCNQTFTFRYTLYFKATGANYYANQVTTLAR